MTGMPCWCQRWCRNGKAASPACLHFPTSSDRRRNDHGNHTSAGGGSLSRRRTRAGRQCHRFSSRRTCRIYDRPRADRQHQAHRGPRLTGARPFTAEEGPDPARLRLGAAWRNDDLGDALRGSADDTPAGRQGWPKGHRIQLFRQRRLRTVRGRDRRHPAAMGGRARSRPQFDRTPNPSRRRGSGRRSADRRETGRRATRRPTRDGQSRCWSILRSPTMATASRSSSSRCCDRSVRCRSRSVRCR